MESIVLTINGQKITCPAGSSVLDAATKNGIHIPTLCHHPQLKPYGACRICLVEDEKTGRLMASCVSPAAPDMVIATDSPRVLKHRRNIVRLMMAEHPESCIVCSKGNRCELRRIAARLGVGESDFYPMPNFKPYEQMNPFIIRDLSKCILCGKCIRADHELVVVGAIDYNHRGFRSRPATLNETPLENSNCTFCGTCVSVCPTGALAAKNSAYAGTPEKEFDSICGFCGAGCAISLGTAGDRIVEVSPSRSDQTANGVTLCVRGHFANDFIHGPDRLVQPMIRGAAAGSGTETGPVHVPATWDTAMGEVVGKLSAVRRRHGPGSLAFIGSPRCSNEENYLFQKIARMIFGTANVVSGGYALGLTLVLKIEEKSHGVRRTGPLSDLEVAEAIVVVHADIGQSVPVAGYHIKRAIKKGVPVIVIDARKTDLSAMAPVWLRPAVLNAADPRYADLIHCLAAHLIHDNAVDDDFVRKYTDGFPEFLQFLKGIDPAQTARECGVKPETVEKAAKRIAMKKIALVVGPDILHLPGGQGIMDAMFNLALLTGGVHEKGTGFCVPVGDSNLIGSMDMGVAPDLLPGRRFLQNADHRAAVGRAWHATISPDPGLDLVGFIEAVESGAVKAAYIMGDNIARSLPQSDRVAAALGKLDFLVVQDILYNRTASLAHVILPGAAMAEKSGSFTNMEGRIQTFVPAVNPPGQALADWEILADLARRMGHPEQYASIEKIRQEIRQIVPMYAGLGSHRQAWIKNNEADNPFSGNGKRFCFSTMAPCPEIKADPAFPFTAFLAPPRFHLGSGTRTSRSERIKSYDGKPFSIQLSMADCRSLGLENADRIRVSSASGAIEGTFEASHALQSGQVMIPLAVSRNQAAALVQLAVPDQNDAFGWTVCRVGIEKI